MKKLVFVVLLVAATATAAQAALKVIGKGAAMRLDASGLPPAMQAGYAIFRVKCVKCHTMERTIIALQTGVAPISGQPFDRNATKAYGAKMLRKPESGMSDTEVRKVVDLLDFLLAKTER